VAIIVHPCSDDPWKRGCQSANELVVWLGRIVDGVVVVVVVVVAFVTKDLRPVRKTFIPAANSVRDTGSCATLTKPPSKFWYK
jgi:hypothetical protein